MCFDLTISLAAALGTWKLGYAGGGPLNIIFDVQIWQMMHHWKAIMLYFWNLQKNCKLSKVYFFLPNLVIYSKMCAKKYKKLLNIHFLKALEHAISNMQKCLLDFL